MGSGAGLATPLPSRNRKGQGKHSARRSTPIDNQRAEFSEAVPMSGGPAKSLSKSPYLRGTVSENAALFCV